MDLLILIALAAFAALLLIYLTHTTFQRSPSPFPGPRSIPFIGNPELLFPKEPWIKLSGLKQTYGPIASISLLGTPLLVLNNYAATRELLEEKSALYSMRPLPKMVEMSGFDKGIVMEHNPARLRHGRRLVHQVLQPKQMPMWRDVLEYHTNVLTRSLLHDPRGFVHHIRHLAAGVNLEVSHGYRVMSRDDAFVKKADEFGENFADASSLQHVVDWVPWLAKLPSWLPGMGFKRQAIHNWEQYLSMSDEGHRMVKEQIANGTARHSLTRTSLLNGEPDDIVKFVATQVYTGGGDTSSALLMSFIRFMVLNPDAQNRGQEEIDRVVGHGRLPTIDDQNDLPFVNAILAEVARHHPPANMLYREALQDDIHNGRFIKKGTILLYNIWSMFHDEDVYPEPHAFKPERWLKQSEDRQPLPHAFDIVFGFGKRVCPGKALGEQVLFLNISRLLALFDFTYARDALGRKIEPRQEMTRGGIISPVPFECSITPRSPRTVEVVQAFLE